jgi:glycerophosphoryl diester phosphodiesterase
LNLVVVEQDNHNKTLTHSLQYVDTPMGSPMTLVYAHRGAAYERPENTISSFKRALELGAGALETDLHRTSDGHIVASHDATLTRMCGVPLVIATSTLAEVQRCDAGWGFVRDGVRPFANQGMHISTLEELLDVFPDTLFNVDAKQRTPSIVHALIDLVQKKRAEHRVNIASFSASTLRSIRRCGYGGTTSLGVDEVLQLYAMPVAWLRAFPFRAHRVQIPRSARGIRLDTQAFITKCHTVGLSVDYWTINDPEEAQHLVALGADGVMTDDPARIVGVV